MAIAVAAAIAGIVLVTHHTGGSTPTAATPTTNGFGAIPGGATSTTDPGSPLGPGAFCAELDRLKQLTPQAQYYLDHGDLGGLRAIFSEMGPAMARLDQRAPADVRTAVDSVNADTGNLVQIVLKAASVDEIKQELADQIPPIIQRSIPLLNWVLTNCPQAPTVTTSAP